MPLPDSLTIGDLDAIAIPRDDGRIAARLGVMATLYFTEPHDAEVRRRLGQSVDLLLAEFRPFYRWRLDPDKKRMVSTQDWSPGPFVARYPTISRDLGIDLLLQGGEHPDDAAQFALACLAQYQVPRTRIGNLTYSASFAWAAAHAPGAWQRLFHEVCVTLRPLHGYGGLGILRNPDYAEARAAEPYILPLARRFPGLELDQPIDHAPVCADGIKGINWLTALGDPLIARLGGGGALAARAAAAGQGLQWTDYPGGGILQAGEVPQLGDFDQGLIPAAYVAADELLRPVRARYDDVILTARVPGLATREERQAFARNWLNRFAGGRP